MMTETQGQAIATAVNRCRPDWDHAGILAALRKARELGAPQAVAAALFRLAENHDLRTPASLADPGRHWQGTTVASRQPPTMCPEPGHESWRALECNDRGPCFDASQLADHDAGAALVRAELAQARATSKPRRKADP